MLKAIIVSSQEKVFIDQKISDFKPLERISVLKGERLSLQLIYTYESTRSPYLHAAIRIKPELSGSLASLVNLRDVCHIPVDKPINNAGTDDNYLRKTPGIYPDVLRPLHYGASLNIAMDMLSSTWIDIDIPRDLEAGEHTLAIKVDGGDWGVTEGKITVDVINAELPREDIYFTQWFHADCLANFYNVEVWSERHWEIVESFVGVARRNGINLLLTPVFTPPLDTQVGGERRTTQLVGVKRDGDKYTFDFTLLDRWIAMCNRQGVEYLEISHLFTQWGAEHAPKVMATVDGEYKRLFGWETAATGEEYSTFLRTFLKELIAHLKKTGDDKRCFFHVSDEPGLQHLENYKAAKAIIADIIKGYPMIDALSKFDFYKTGALETPICSNNHITPFLEAGVENLWTYYCVSQPVDVSNRYVSMPSWRTRSIGMQMFKYNIKGFLHWGYNFYNNQYSEDPLNPFLETSAAATFPTGDSFSVYPAMNGTALESIRLVVFYEALQDIKAMKLCESLYSHDEVVSAMEEVFGKEITFETCTKSSDMMLRIREKVNMMIKARV